MVMNIEIMESWTDYSAVATGNCPMSTYWILSNAANNLGIVNSAFDATDKALKMAGGSFFPTQALRMFAAPVTKVTMALGFWMTDPADWSPWCRLVDAAGVTQMSFFVNNVGKLVVAGEGGVVLATSYTNFALATVYRLCFSAEILAANSVRIKCSVNGYDDPGLSVTADFVDQATQVFAGFRFVTTSDYPGGAAGNVEFLDLMVGTGEIADWGPLELIEGPPNVDIVQGWTRLSGADNFAMVDEPQANGDTDYNSTETLNAKDIFGFTDPEVPERIIAIGMVSWHKKEDSATRRYRHLLRVSGVDYPGADLFAAESYSRSITAWLKNPETLADWQGTDLAPLQFGYEYLGP